MLMIAPRRPTRTSRAATLDALDASGEAATRHARGGGARALRRALAVLAVAGGFAVQACAGHEAQTLPVRSALDAGHPQGAIGALNEALGVKADKDLPPDIQGDKALFVLDRATIQQSLTQFAKSKSDFQAADKAIDMLDLAHNAGDSIGAYIFSGSSARYVAPPYEKLLINTLNMLNYLETRDLSGALVEARRLAVVQRYIRDELNEADNAILGLGGFLAGFAYEKSGQTDEALRYYDEALRFTGFQSLRSSVAELARASSFRTPRIQKLLATTEGETGAGGRAGETSAGSAGPKSGAATAAPASAPSGADVVVVVGYGRVPHKIPERVPIGLALTMVSGALSPYDHARANRLAAQGLVTWVNYPTLAPGQGAYEIPTCQIDGRPVGLEQAVDVSAQVRTEWKKVEGKIVVSAITRMISRLMVGEAIRNADNKSPIALLLSLGAQATLTALDKPDTRSWETLPARVAVMRVRVPAGSHRVSLMARGVTRTQTVDVRDGDWAVVSLQALR